MTETQSRGFFSRLKEVIISVIPPSLPTAEEVMLEAERELVYDRLRKAPQINQLVKDGTLPKPEGVPEGQYGHALMVLQTFFESRALRMNPEVTERLKLRIREKVEKGILPPTAIDLLDYEEEPTDWRE